MKLNKKKNLASPIALPGLSLLKFGYLTLILFVGSLSFSGCSQFSKIGIGQSNSSLATSSISTSEVVETVRPTVPTIAATQKFEQTPTLTATSHPFEPLKVSATDCGYGGSFKSIEALDVSTVQFMLCEPDVAFLSKIAFPAFSIYSAEWLAGNQNSGDFHQILKNPIGAGPYQVIDWKPGEVLSYRAFENYWDMDKPRMPNLDFTWNKDPSERLLALQTYVVDGIDNVNHTDFSLVEDDPDAVLYQRPSMNVFYIGINNEIPPYNSELVRQALALALNRQKIVEVAFPDGYEVATHFTPCAVPFACEGDDWYPYDPELAKDLLSEAGYPNGFQTELFYRDVLRGYLPLPDQVAEEIRTQLWENLRVNVKVRKVDQNKFIDAVDTGAIEGLYLLGWGADFPDVSNFLDNHFGANASRQFGEKNAELVRLLEDGAGEINIENRKEIYRKANNLILQEIPMIPVAHGDWYSQDHLAVAYHNNVQNAPVAAFGFESFLDTSVSGQDTFVWMQSEEPISLYCAAETDTDSLRACMQISEPLYKFQNNRAVAVPGLAKNCGPNEDLTVWTCNLREGVYFHDGSLLDANDVVTSFWIQWDDTHPIHIGIAKEFDYFRAFWGSFTSIK